MLYHICNEPSVHKQQFGIFGDGMHVIQAVMQVIITNVHSKHGNPIILYMLMLVLYIVCHTNRKDENL